MKCYLQELSINRRLALIAVVLGIIAIFIPDPRTNATARFDSKALALEINNKTAHIEVMELAKWLIEGKGDFVLVDLRDDKKFSEYHINTSQNIQVADLQKSNLLRTQKIILYSDDNFQTAQAWLLLKTNGYKAVYQLKGGFADWKNQILFPKLSANASPEEMKKFEEIKQISKFFGGTPMIAGAEEQSQEIKPMQMPKISAPSAPSAGAKGGKPKKEGC